MLVCGVDEAGRGPVAGPLVMAGVVMDEKDIFRLENIGVKDSKLLSLMQRERMFDQIKEIVKGFEILVIGPEEVDEAVLSKTMNLNKLEAVKSAEIINKLKPDIAYLDCPSNNISSYTNFLNGYVKNEVKIIAEHKADLIYPIVSAASILAKVTRDREIERIKQKHNIEFGSGYPSDPRTVRFLKENFDKYDFFRKSWATYKKIADSKKQSSLGGF